MYHLQGQNDSSEHDIVYGSVLDPIAAHPPQLDVRSIAREQFRNGIPLAGPNTLIDFLKDQIIKYLKADERKGRGLRVIDLYAHDIGGIRDEVEA